MKVPAIFVGIFLATSGTSVGQEVSLSVFRPSDGVSRTLAQSEVTLEYQSIEVGPSSDIQSVLTRNGIYADGESLGLLYEVNPGLDPEQFPLTGTLMVPVPSGGTEWQAAQEDGFLLAVTRDVGLKRGLLSEAERLTTVARRFPEANAVSLLEPAVRREVLESLNVSQESVTALRTVIEQRNRPITRGVLVHATSEAEMLNDILYRNLSSTKQLTADDRETMKLVAENMQIRAEILREERGPGQLPPPWPMVEILVKTRLAGGEDAHSLRIYYVPQALYGLPEHVESFHTLTTPSQGSVPPANYMIWAGQPGNPEPASDVVTLSAREKGQSEPEIVELLVRERRE